MSERSEREARAVVRTLIDTGWVSRAVNELFPGGRDPVTQAIAAALDARTEACAKIAERWVGRRIGLAAAIRAALSEEK